MSDPPKPPPTDDEWRNRFIILNLVRIGGAAIAVFGAAVMQTDLLRPGGWIGLGLPVALLGLLISFGWAQVLVRRWRTPPAP
jgi:hypothetical protein